MHWVDAVIIVVIVACAVFGMARGIFLQAALIGGAFGGLVVSRVSYGNATDFLAMFFPRSGLLTAAAFGLVFLQFWVLVGLLALTIRDGLRFIPRGPLDKLGGVVLGAAMGALLIEAVLILGGQSHDPTLRQALTAAYLPAPFHDMVPGVRSLMPSDFLPTAH